ncbi:MAG: hypothetical protein ACFFD2_29645, partial [Promethearchaeota archaeon]
MKTWVQILSLTTIIIASILYFLPVQTTGVTELNLIEETDGYQLSITTGPDLEDLTSGYNVTESDSYSYICTYSFAPFYYNVSDIIRYNITEANNSMTSFGWTADCIWSTIESYNSYLKTWTDYVMGGSTFYEYLVAGYNSKNAYSGGYGNYHCFTDSIDVNYSSGFLPVKIPHNFTAANYSIVNEIVSFLKDPMGADYTNVFFTTPPPGNIAGTWFIWTNDGTVDVKFFYSYNGNGTLTQYIEQIGGMGTWLTLSSWVLQGEGGTALDP